MFSNYQGYGSQPVQSSMYNYNGIPYSNSYNMAPNGYFNGMTSSFDMFTRVTQLLSSTSEAVHMTFSSAIHLFSVMRTLYQEFDSFHTNFSIIFLLKKLALTMKAFLLKLSGRFHSASKVLEEASQPLNLSHYLSPLAKATDHFFIFSISLFLLKALKNLFRIAYNRLSPYETAVGFFTMGQQVEVYLPHGGQPAFCFSASGARCEVSVERGEIHISDGLLKEQENAKNSLFLAKKERKTAEIKCFVSAPNGNYIPLKLAQSQMPKFERYLESREKCISFENGRSNGNSQKERNKPNNGDIWLENISGKGHDGEDQPSLPKESKNNIYPEMEFYEASEPSQSSLGADDIKSLAGARHHHKGSTESFATSQMTNAAGIKRTAPREEIGFSNLNDAVNSFNGVGFAQGGNVSGGFPYFGGFHYN